MAVLGPGRKLVALRLLDWDRKRVKQREAEGFDCTLYRARQDLAEACIEIDTAQWPQEIRFLFMALLEVTRTPSKAREEGIGPLKPVVQRLTLAERLAYRALAQDLGVIDRLREVAPRQWADVDTEGD